MLAEMHGYFTFTIHSTSSRERELLIFSATPEPRTNDFIDIIKRHSESHVSPDHVRLLGFESEAPSLTEITADSRISDLLSHHGRYVGPPKLELTLIPRTGIPDKGAVGEKKWREITHAGLKAIFASRQALLVAPATHHFAKPSKRHCDRFIRTANALVDGAEIAFIAACCLPHVPERVRHFYCDTGGISVLALAIDSLRRRFNHDLPAATVNTFESYAGLEKFEFRDTEESIVLVSASTSGGLEKQICHRERSLRTDQIITLFSIGERAHTSPVVLNLESDTSFRESLGRFVSYEEAKCPLCRDGSIAVPMLGEQFIPVRSETQPIIINRQDAPTWLQRFLRMVVGTGVLKAFYRSPNTQNAVSDVFVDLESLLKRWDLSHALTRRIYRGMCQTIPVATKRLIHLDDAASALLSRRIAEEFKSLTGTEIDVLSAKKARQAETLDSGATAVVAAAVASGQSMLAVSQALRMLQTNGAISYFVALSRMASPQDVDKLERDLRMGEQITDYALCVADRINLPVAGRSSRTSWDEELAFLQEIADRSSDQSAVAIIEQRIQTLRIARGSDSLGMDQKLFWPSSTSGELKLRHGFVFFPNELDATRASQGDVYFTVVALLHHLRHGNGQKSALRQTEYARRVLSPLCFDRFNDGVIQAALVRAAIRPELDYSSSPELSKQMAGVLKTAMTAFDTQQGEASREFLLALALRRLVLATTDLQQLHDDVAGQETDVISGILWDHIKTSVLG